ncbi:MAG: DUF433 domain-containing protein [Thermoanaerobaculia bacterium]
MATLTADPLPLSQDASGVIRIGGTRVSLDSFVAAYEAGASARYLAEAFPDLSLPDIHATIAYLLRHPEEVAEYVATRRREARAAEARFREEFPEAYGRLHPDEESADPSAAES